MQHTEGFNFPEHLTFVMFRLIKQCILKNVAGCTQTDAVSSNVSAEGNI
jgi:hypothetical protein